MYYIYIIYSEKRDRYYTGYTSTLEQRLRMHNDGCTKSTKAGVPWKIVYTESFQTKSDAMAREYAIKRKKSRRYIEWLINSNTE